MTVANPKRGYEKMVLGGKERLMKYTMNSMIEVEEKLGIKTLKDWEKFEDHLDTKTIRYLLTVALNHEEPDLTEIEVGGFDDLNFKESMLKVTKCMKNYFGVDKGKSPQNQKKMTVPESAQKK